MTDDTIALRSQGARATVALRGAEPVSWQVGGVELLWSGDPEWWNRHAPILFPVVGASSGGVVRVGGQTYPMAQHGFARDSRFAVVAQGEDYVHLRLTDDDDTRGHYPFAFRFDVVATLRPDALVLDFTVENPGSEPLPHAVGFHPAFRWPLDGASKADHAVIFSSPVPSRVPLFTPDGCFLDADRAIPLDGTRLPLADDLFEAGALVFAEAGETEMAFTGPSGASITLAARDMPDLAIWTKPGAPFISLECWTGHADRAGFTGPIEERPGIRMLAPGKREIYTAEMRYRLD